MGGVLVRLLISVGESSVSSGRGTDLGRMNAMTMQRIPRLRKPRTRAVHAKPILGRSCCTRIGYIMPPALFPVVVMPIAIARRDEKYVPIKPMLGVKKRPPPMPVYGQREKKSVSQCELCSGEM